MPYKDYEVLKAKMRSAYQNLSPEGKRQHSLRCAERRRLRRQALVDAFGGKCQWCGFADSRALQFDHKASNGNQDRQLERTQLWKKIETHPDQFQLLCANCNTIKRFKCNELNHYGRIEAGNLDPARTSPSVGAGAEAEEGNIPLALERG